MKTNIFISLILMTSILHGCNGSDNGQTCEAASNPVLENMAGRVSVRSYTDEKVPEEMIEKMLRAGMAAPCAKNRQLWEFIVVDDRATLDTLSAGLIYAKMLVKAPLAIVVCVKDHYMDKDGQLKPHDCWLCDGAVAAENILLAAHSLGLGAVYTASQDDARSAVVRSVLGIPEEVHPVCVIPVGWPDSPNTPKDKWKPEKIHRNRY